MRPVRFAATLATLAAFSALGLSACGSSCQELGNRICGCTVEGAPRAACETSVKNQVEKGTYRPDATDQAYCEAKLATCPDPTGDQALCERLATPQGKIDCGLAYPLP
jgi:hypothetical protein